jgi:two-component system sensor histidine kinase UhpB
MKRQAATRLGYTDYLSVIHKSAPATVRMGDPVFQTDLQFNLINWNTTAELLYGQSNALGKNIFGLIDVEFLQSSREELEQALLLSGSWTGEVLYKRYDGSQHYFKTTATCLINQHNEPQSVMVVCHNITEAKEKEQLLATVESRYQILLDTLPEGVIMLDEEGRIAAVNRNGAQILGLTEEDALGKILDNTTWKVIRKDGSVFPAAEFPANVSLQTGFPQRNVIMGITKPDETLTWLSVNSEALIRPGEFDPYAVVVSFSDITEQLKTEEELNKSNERFYYVSKVTSDAIWDADLETKSIYRSAAFSRLSGYTADEISPSLDWWFEKIHPEDQERVKTKLNGCIDKRYDRWEDEYRFLCGNGSYRHLHDTGIVLFKNSKPVRMLGAIRDVTENKRLQKQLLEEQLQRHKAISLASIAAQEQEKTNLGRELHDNVNQILLSAKLFMDTARKNPEQTDELLEKAIEYQLLALQEIRKLSRSLSTSHLKTVGLKESVSDIVKNMKLLQQLQVEFIFNDKAEEKLTDDQKLMVFRIIQEQTSNITRHAAASEVQIMLNVANNMAHLVISDNGKGFDKTAGRSNGIGFANIMSRADAYNGKVNIVSSPGNGCTLELCFPVA